MCGIPLWLLVYGTGALLVIMFVLVLARSISRSGLDSD